MIRRVGIPQVTGGIFCEGTVGHESGAPVNWSYVMYLHLLYCDPVGWIKWVVGSGKNPETRGPGCAVSSVRVFGVDGLTVWLQIVCALPILPVDIGEVLDRCWGGAALVCENCEGVEGLSRLFLFCFFVL